MHYHIISDFPSHEASFKNSPLSFNLDDGTQCRTKFSFDLDKDELSYAYKISADGNCLTMNPKEQILLSEYIRCEVIQKAVEDELNIFDHAADLGLFLSTKPRSTPFSVVTSA